MNTNDQLTRRRKADMPRNRAERERHRTQARVTRQT